MKNFAIKPILLFFAVPLFCKAQLNQKQAPLETPWTKKVNILLPLNEYPRPNLVRQNWTNLNGQWDYSIAQAGATPIYSGKILVPFPLESALSGVMTSLTEGTVLWYKRSFFHTNKDGKKYILHFGAVDNDCTVFINGKEVGNHKGGYTEFSFDISSYLISGNNEIVVKVLDPTDKGLYPHGKQVNTPANIYYTASSGIWQTVWIEDVPIQFIEKLVITPDIDQKVLKLNVVGNIGNYDVELFDGKKRIDGLTSQQANSTIEIPIPNQHLWTPTDPHLYDLVITSKEDQVKSYFGMRKVSIAKDEKGIDRIFLNNKPYYNLGTLDQGFWPDGLYTAPTDEALAFDIKIIKAMGFNTIRKHIKVEPARWYYHADKLGMLVWQDMVNPNQSLPTGAKEAFEKQSLETMEQLHNYPSIVCWVLFNEKWGAYDQQRLTELMKKKDPSRIVNGHSGEILYVNEKLRSPSPNAYVSADMTDIHAYPNPMMPEKQNGKAQVVGEFGGIGVFIPDHQWNRNSAWGYIQEKPAALSSKYEVMNQNLRLLEHKGLSGSIYTQPFDVEGEQNGLVTYDRKIIKVPLKSLQQIHRPLNPEMGILPKVEVKDADTTDPLNLYKTMFGQYLNGKSDQEFLYQLAMQAKQNNDLTALREFIKTYLQQAKRPLSSKDIQLVYQVTESPRDPGFEILQQERAAINVLLGKRKAEGKIQNLIYSEYIDPRIKSGEPDWEKINNSVSPYGEDGEEILLRAKTIYYLNAKDWLRYKPLAKSYLEKFGANINTREKTALEKALNN